MHQQGSVCSKVTWPGACHGIPWTPALLHKTDLIFPWQFAADLRIEIFAEYNIVMNNIGSLITCVLFILLLNLIQPLYYIQRCHLARYVKPTQLLPSVQ